MKKTNKTGKKYLIAILIVFLLALAIGYAAFNDVLTITGTASANGTFDLEFTSQRVVKEVGVTSANIEKTADDELTVTVEDIAYPGAGAAFEAVITNVGTTPAVLKAVTPEGLDDNASIKVKGLDAITTAHEVIQPNGTCTIQFTVEWEQAAEGEVQPELTDAEKSGVEFSLVLEYAQDPAAVLDTEPSHTDA